MITLLNNESYAYWVITRYKATEENRFTNCSFFFAFSSSCSFVVLNLLILPFAIHTGTKNKNKIEKIWNMCTAAKHLENKDDSLLANELKRNRRNLFDGKIQNHTFAQLRALFTTDFPISFLFCLTIIYRMAQWKWW